ncbi:hypothetical protein BDK51DRAFT_28872 [Blyttiomyces helicus]|uniref:Uncharacterized protein n=1 Tax=Blyttiomyces helicus TaxID=388810 RepID=A0A4P9WFI1_9FUNG|nr:hypothetical protein BDK51DRAFT_28872 [Blyttiomyces helicus]|eukprot:RKO90513.1 hypothetical protein BDK51DRAFT_28872 [Blyttiomyces helicus]
MEAKPELRKHNYDPNFRISKEWTSHLQEKPERPHPEQQLLLVDTADTLYNVCLCWCPANHCNWAFPSTVRHTHTPTLSGSPKYEQSSWEPYNYPIYERYVQYMPLEHTHTHKINLDPPHHSKPRIPPSPCTNLTINQSPFDFHKSLDHHKPHHHILMLVMAHISHIRATTPAPVIPPLYCNTFNKPSPPALQHTPPHSQPKATHFNANLDLGT